MKPSNNSNLVWIDMEFTGLDDEKDVVLEIATIITDTQLNIIAEGPDIVIHQTKEILSSMDEWNTKTHTESGLTEKVAASSETHESAQTKTLEFIKKHVGEKQSPLCGNSVHTDRRFLKKHMPYIDEYLHYRHIDVTSVKELAARWYPKIPEYMKKNNHRAKEDIIESIEELKYYREKIFNPR